MTDHLPSLATMNPPSTELQEATTHALQEGEELLWAQRRHKRVDKNLCICVLGGLIFLALSIVYLHYMINSPEEAGKSNFYLCIMVFFALFCLGTAVLLYRVNARIIYAVTNCRALIFLPGFLGKPMVYSLPLSQKLIYRVVRRHNGTADYMMYTEEVGNHTTPGGFRFVREPDELEMVLAHLGVSLPKDGKKRHVAYRVEYRPPAPLSVLFWYIGAVIALALVLPTTITSDGADLYLRGESAQARIIGHQKHTRAVHTRTGKRTRKSREKVSILYPIFVYTTPEGKHYRATDINGSVEPDWKPGDTVEVLYDPKQPNRAMRKDSSVLIPPALVLLLGLWLLWRGHKSTQRLRATRTDSYRLFTAEEI